MEIKEKECGEKGGSGGARSLLVVVAKLGFQGEKKS